MLLPTVEASSQPFPDVVFFILMWKILACSFRVKSLYSGIGLTIFMTYAKWYHIRGGLCEGVQCSCISTNEAVSSLRQIIGTLHIPVTHDIHNVKSSF